MPSSKTSADVMRTDFKQLRATDTLLYAMEQMHAWYPKRSHVLVVQKDDKETYYFLMTRAEFAKQVRRAWSAHDYGRTLAEVLRIRASDASRTTDAGGKLQNPTKPTVVLANGKAAGYLPGKGSGGALAPVTSLPYPVLLTGPPKTPVGKGVGRDAVPKKGGGDGGRRIAVKGPVVKSGAPAKTAVLPKKVAAKKSMAKHATSRYTARAKPPARSGGSRASEIYVPSEPREVKDSPPVAVTGGSGGHSDPGWRITLPNEYGHSDPYLRMANGGADEVTCSVFSPGLAAPGEGILIQAYAHLPGQEEQVAAMAEDATSRPPCAAASRSPSRSQGARSLASTCA